MATWAASSSGETHYVHDMRPVFDKTPWRYLEPKDFPIGSMCHPIALLTWYLGEVEEVFAYGGQQRGRPTLPGRHPGHLLVNLRFRNGAIGRILGAFGIVEPPLPMEIAQPVRHRRQLVHDKLVLDRLPGQPVAHIGFRQRARPRRRGEAVSGRIRPRNPGRHAVVLHRARMRRARWRLARRSRHRWPPGSRSRIERRATDAPDRTRRCHVDRR